MEKYDIIKKVGSGSYGCVWRARNKLTGEVVAIKMLKEKYSTWEECLNLIEVKSLRKMNHPNIVKLQEVIKEHGNLYLVFEYMECNLLEFIHNTPTTHLSETELKYRCLGVFQGLTHMHQNGFFHRDLKPENILVAADGTFKIADLGMAREINSKCPYTEYVTTRWYRAPEIILRAPKYGPAIDMWAMGAIMAELFTQHPLFEGSNEFRQIYEICRILGNPMKNIWPQGLELANALNFQFPQTPGVNLSTLIPASQDAINLIQSLCSWDPCKRPTAAEALQHPFFRSCFRVLSIPSSLTLKEPAYIYSTVHRAPRIEEQNTVRSTLSPNSLDPIYIPLKNFKNKQPPISRPQHQPQPHPQYLPSAMVAGGWNSGGSSLLVKSQEMLPQWNVFGKVGGQW